MTLANAFADAVQRLHSRQGGDEEAVGTLRQAAISLWEASAEGHACIELDEPGLRARLAESPAVASEARAEAAAPLVLDGRTLYLHRLWQAETQLALGLDALDVAAPLAGPERIEQVLDELAPEARVDPLQRQAIRSALTRRLAVVTGGPGTGKTTTIARLLVACMRLAPQTRVAIAAPTGKAAARLAQALAAQLAQLDASGTLSRVLPATGMTVHALLGLRGDSARAREDLARHDLIIVDEASMLDLELARALVDSVPERGRLVLAGDQDQLASVEAGAVFAELCASVLAGVTRLERNYRQAGAPALTALAIWLRDRHKAVAQLELPFGLPTTSTEPASAGNAASASSRKAASASLRKAASAPASAPGSGSGSGSAPFDRAAGIERLSAESALPIVTRALAAWEPAFAAIDEGESAAQILERFDRHRVLCALREGPLGVVALNAGIAARVRRRVSARPSAHWYVGRLVMVTQNRPELELSNGDVGVSLPMPGDSSGNLAVAFGAGGKAIRWLPVRQMPGHEDAYAMTVHKSQGSEFDSVALVPAPLGHRLNTRELLYTGATRARSRLTVWAENDTLEDGARRRTARHGRLADRLQASKAARNAAGEGPHQ